MLDRLVYLVYPLILVIAFWGAKFYGRKQWNEGAFSLQQMKMMQAFCAICIMLHHAGQKTCASWLNPRYIIPGLELFVPIGYFLVAVFLFCSGYGLYKSYLTKENYLQGFVKRRILPLVLGYYLSGAVYLLARWLMGEKFTPWSLFCYISGIKLCNTNAWFVIALPIFYLAFYLAFRFCKNKNLALFFTILTVFVYTWIGTAVNHNDYWMRGEWWYNSVHMFPVGLLFAKWEDKLVPRMKKWYPLRLFGAFLLMLLFYRFSVIAQNIWGYYGEDWGADHIILRRWGTLLTQVAASYFFVAFLFLLGMKVRFGNKVLIFFSGITLEFYLIHGVFVELFGFSFLDITKPLFYIKNVAAFVAVVSLLGIPSALLLKAMMNFILGEKKQEITKNG